MDSGIVIAGSNRDAERLTGIMLGASVFLMLAHIAADVALGHGRISTVLILLYGIPACLAGSAMYVTFRRDEPTLAMFSAYCFAGHGLLMVLTAVVLLAGLQFPEEFALYGAEPRSLSGTASMLELVMDKTGKASFAFLGLGLSLVGLVILLSGALPRWVGWLGMVVGIFGFLASLAGLVDVFGRGTTEPVMGISSLSSLAYMVILGLRFVLRQIPEACGNRPERAFPL